jgi:hypothetical protein
VADLYKGEYNGLPDRDVRTIRDLIHYQCASRTLYSPQRHGGHGEIVHGEVVDLWPKPWRFGSGHTPALRAKRVACRNWLCLHVRTMVRRRCPDAAVSPHRDKTSRALLHCPSSVPSVPLVARSGTGGEIDTPKGDRGLYSFYKAKHPGQKKYYHLIPSSTRSGTLYQVAFKNWKIRSPSNTNSTLYRTPSPISAER